MRQATNGIQCKTALDGLQATGVEVVAFGVCIEIEALEDGVEVVTGRVDTAAVAGVKLDTDFNWPKGVLDGLNTQLA